MKRALAATVFSIVLPLAAGPARAQQACPLATIGTAKVAAVRDGRTLLLADGRVLRLAAIEVTGASRAALQALAAGRALRLAKLGPDHDRYGRLVAFAFVDDAGQSLQQTMLEQGQARVAARVGDKACADALLAAERQARAARRGLWADPNFAPLPAESSTRLEGERGRFALVEGKVLSVRESGGTIYVNFGRRWTRDFSVIILRHNERRFTAAGLAPKQLEGRRVLVRGWLEQRRGPVIEADAPEQIELEGAAGQ
jgi:endonuclease YncB( thermonuclease family)